MNGGEGLIGRGWRGQGETRGVDAPLLSEGDCPAAAAADPVFCPAACACACAVVCTVPAPLCIFILVTSLILTSPDPQLSTPVSQFNFTSFALGKPYLECFTNRLPWELWRKKREESSSTYALRSAKVPLRCVEAI